ncbi:hypothetical protein BCR44DRAFT_1425562, partial [Catenaria anguillulae PL171]
AAAAAAEAAPATSCPASGNKSARPRLPPRCRFFAQGHCREGDKCRFRHELKPQAQPASKQDKAPTAAATAAANATAGDSPKAPPSSAARNSRNNRNPKNRTKKPTPASATTTRPDSAATNTNSTTQPLPPAEAATADADADTDADAAPRTKRKPRQRTRKPKPKPEHASEPEPAQEAELEPPTPRQSHLAALRSTYPSTTLVTPTSITLSFAPSDPDFPYPLDQVHLSLTLPLDYPTSPPSVLLTNADIPQDVRDIVAKSIAHRLASNQSRLSLVQVVQWIDKNLEKLIKGDLDAPKSTLVFVRPGTGAAAARAPMAKPGSDQRNRDAELKALERRFRASWIQVSQEEMQLTLEPTDPEWSFPGLNVHLGLTLPLAYGSDASVQAQWRVLNTDTSPRLAGKMEQVLREAGEAGIALLQSVNKLDRALVGIVAGLAEEDEQAEDEQIRDVSSDSSLTSDDEDEHEEQQQITSNAQLAVPKSGATQIKFPALALSGISVLECTSLSILLTCVRCKHASEFHAISPLAPGTSLEWQLDSPHAPGMQPCSKCAAPMGIRWTAALMHAAHPVLGYASLLNATPMDLLPSTYSATCAACTSAGQVKVTCRACHAALSVGYEVVRFLRVGSGGLRVKASDEGIVPGQPLPKMGRCTHYSKSAFPCDVCHEKAKSDGHEMVRANRQICGYCSKEQPFSAAGGCAFCHASLVAKSSSGFWEGGKGTRDVVKMSRGESKKFKGLAKTVSKKGERVGKEGAEKVKKDKEKSK